MFPVRKHPNRASVAVRESCSNGGQADDTDSIPGGKPRHARGQFERSAAESVALSSVLVYDDASVFVKIDAEGEEARIVPDLLAVDGIDERGGFLELHVDKLGDGPDPILETLEAEGSRTNSSSTRPAGYYFTNAAVQESSPFDAVGVT